MNKQKASEPSNRFQLVYSIALLAGVALALWIGAAANQKASAQKFPGPTSELVTMAFPANAGSLGAIPDSSAVGLNVTFPVSGFPSGQSVTNVSLGLSIDHTWIGDLIGTLSAPTPFPNSHILFQRIGSSSGTGAGSPTNFVTGGTYTFEDAATANIWTTVFAGGNAFNVPFDAYRTSAPMTGTFTNMNSSFATVIVPFTDSREDGPQGEKGSFEKLPSQLANGTWTFNITDNATGDFGNVTAATLTITTLAPTAAAASISGRILSSNGSGLRFVNVTLTGGALSQPRYATTNTFGYYAFETVPIGDTYILSVSSKRNTFINPTRVLTLIEDIAGIDFIGYEIE